MFVTVLTIAHNANFIHGHIRHIVLSVWSVSWIIRYCNIALDFRDIVGPSKASSIEMRNPIRYVNLAISGHINVLATKVTRLSEDKIMPLK